MADEPVRVQLPLLIVADTALVKVNVVVLVTVTVCSPLMAATAAAVQPPVPAATLAIVTTWLLTNELVAVVTVTVLPVCVRAVGVYATLLP